jgi:hypothetical protein
MPISCDVVPVGSFAFSTTAAKIIEPWLSFRYGAPVPVVRSVPSSSGGSTAMC